MSSTLSKSKMGQRDESKALREVIRNLKTEMKQLKEDSDAKDFIIEQQRLIIQEQSKALEFTKKWGKMLSRN